MKAAIKVLEDTLLIRRLQAREFQGDGAACERLAILNRDIASLERGLSALSGEREASSVKPLSEISDPKSENAPRSTLDAPRAKCPTIGDPAQNPPEAS